MLIGVAMRDVDIVAVDEVLMESSAKRLREVFLIKLPAMAMMSSAQNKCQRSDHTNSGLPTAVVCLLL